MITPLITTMLSQLRSSQAIYSQADNSFLTDSDIYYFSVVMVFHSLWYRISLFPVIEELCVGEGVCPVSRPTLLLQEQPHAVPRWVGDAAAPQRLRDPQQFPHMLRDGLQAVQHTAEGIESVISCLYLIMSMTLTDKTVTSVCKWIPRGTALSALIYLISMLKVTLAQPTTSSWSRANWHV